jgi:hypothetical protein
VLRQTVKIVKIKTNGNKCHGQVGIEDLKMNDKAGKDMNEETDGERFPRQQVMKVFEDWFDAKPSIYPPNRHDIVEWKRGKMIRRDHNKIIALTKEDYSNYHAVDAKYSTILFEFIPGGKRMDGFGENGPSVLKTKELDGPWSFGSCHSCWKKKTRNFSNTKKTQHPYRTTIDDPNLSVLGGCGCVICNGCVMQMEKYAAEEELCTGCSYCGYPTSFPKDLRMWCISEQVQTNYEISVKKERMELKVEEMRREINKLGVPVKSMHLSADGEMSYTMDINKVKDTKKH